MFNINDAVEIANKLNIKFNKFNIKDFLTGLNIELEHGTINPETNITNNNLELTAKIALAHLNEYPNYYNKEYGLPNFEKTLKEKLSQKWQFLNYFFSIISLITVPMLATPCKSAGRIILVAWPLATLAKAS